MIGAWYWKKMDSKVPGHIYLFQNQDAQMDFGVPLEGSCEEAEDVIAITNGNTTQEGSQLFELDRPVRIKASTLGSYQAELKLFGILPRPGLKCLLILPYKIRQYTRTWPFYLIN